MALFFWGAPMRVYYTGQRNNHQMAVAPAADPRGGAIDSEWIDARGKPVTFHVNFVDGVAEVPDALGRYLVKTGMAKRTRLWLPAGFIDRAA